MKTKLKVLTGLVLLIFLTSSLTLVALAGASSEDEGLLGHEEVSWAPDGIGLLATTFIVDTTNDGSDASPGDGSCDTGAGQCTLRAAIEEANVLPGPDTITLPGGGGDYVLTSGQLVISTTVTINGGGAGSTTIDGNANDRIFRIVSSGNVSISDVTMTNGSAGKGGAIENLGTLSLNNVTVSNSVATGNGGGGIINDGGAPGGGMLTVLNSTIISNTARGGGGIHNQNGTVTISNTIISSNTSTAPAGNLGIGVGGGVSNAAIDDDSSITIYQSTISGNKAEGTGGGGINNNASGTDHTATMILSQTVVSGNDAKPKPPFDFNHGFGGGIRNGFADPANGNTAAILILNDSIVSGNEAVNGAGIGSGTTSTTPTLRLSATVDRSTISDNTTTFQNGENLEGSGGGLVNVNGTLSLVNSTVSGNAATGTNVAGGQGGGIFNGDLGLTTALWLTNTTIANNTAQSSAKGDGVANIQTTDTTANFKNSIIAGGCFNFNGTFSSQGNNLDDDNSCNLTTTGDITNTNPLLESLQANGGPTVGATGATAPMLTHALLGGSPALGAGDNTTCNAAPVNGVDQRGESRPQEDPDCDIGAYESDLPSGSGSGNVYLPIVIKNS